MKIRTTIALAFFAILLTSGASAESKNAARPNILIILADDLGYGDVGCYNPESKVPTPNLNRLAKDGMRFTDAHSPSTVCTPTRYSILTGRLAFRTGMRGVFTGDSGPCTIEKGRLTIGNMLKKGYTTSASQWPSGVPMEVPRSQRLRRQQLWPRRQMGHETIRINREIS